MELAIDWAISAGDRLDLAVEYVHGDIGAEGELGDHTVSSQRGGSVEHSLVDTNKKFQPLKLG
jgi:hypothetical protein